MRDFTGREEVRPAEASRACVLKIGGRDAEADSVGPEALMLREWNATRGQLPSEYFVLYPLSALLAE